VGEGGFGAQPIGVVSGGRRPLVRGEDVVAFGFRDSAEAAKAGMQPLPPRLRTIDLAG
jgi:arginase